MKYLLLISFCFICAFSNADEADSLISKKEVRLIKPVINKWLKFHDFDITKFRGKMSDPISLEKLAIEEDTTSMYYHKFDKEYDDIYLPVLYDYSPNKRFYLNLRQTAGVYQEDDRKWYYRGGDDCLEIYLTDRKKGNKALVHWLGALSFVEGAFWLKNDAYIIVGYEYYDTPRYFIQIAGKYNGRYYLEVDELSEKSYFEHDVKSRGIICD